MTNPTYVPGIGSKNAKIVFIGEAPGKNEETKREPFVGYSGQLFRNTLSRVGISESEIYITNVCHYRPPGNKISRWCPRRGGTLVPNELVTEGIRELYALLAEINPRLIVPLGNVALWTLCGVQTITKRRGSILGASWGLERASVFNGNGPLSEHIEAVKGTKVIPTLHPAYVLRQMESLAIFQTDLGRIRDDSSFRELRLPERTYHLNPDESELGELVSELLGSKLLAYDIESPGGRLYCVGFSCDPSWGLTLSTSSPSNMEVIRELLSSPVPKVAQNGLFDLTFLRIHSDLVVEAYEHDTMYAQHCAYPSLPKGLDFLCSVYTREPYYKDSGKEQNKGNRRLSDPADVEQYLTYNCKDSCTTLEISLSQQANELQDPAYKLTYDRIMSQLPVYAEQMIEGIRVDTEKQACLYTKIDKERKKLQKEFDEEGLGVLAELFNEAKSSGEEKRADMIETFLRGRAKKLGTVQGAINVNGYVKLGVFLYDIIGLKEKKKKDKYGKMVRTTDEDAMKELYGETGNEIVLFVVNIRKKRKRLSSYLSLSPDSNGYVRFSVKPTNTKTGRSAYGDTITKEGLNFQTVPHELRSMYVPS